MMRFTIVDTAGTVSFAGPGHCAKVLIAGCSSGPSDFRSLLERVREFDGQFVDGVLNSLAIFDEQVLDDRPETADRWLEQSRRQGIGAFRVYNQALRNLSLTAERLGIVLFNLRERRIVQIENSYGELLRSDRGRIRIDGNPVNRFYHYTLPDTWTLFP
jgi:hypothetical protein